MEGRERTSVEARIRCLRNIQVLLDAAVMEMQQYSAVVARANGTAPPGVAPGMDAAATAASNTPDDASSSAADTGASEETDTAASSASTSGVSSSSTPTTSTVFSVSSTATSSTSAVVPPELPRPLLSPSETGARPKVPASASVASKAESSSKEEKSGEGKGEKPKSNPFDALSEEPATRTAEQVFFSKLMLPGDQSGIFQEEIRKRRLAVFEEQKKRLMNK
jgi:hypothetical protein